MLNFALYKKQYPHDTCGIIERKIQLLQQTGQETALSGSNLQLSVKKGIKVNFIRVLNCLCELSYFTDLKGNNITKREVFNTFGKTINQDLTSFHNDLSSAKSNANSDMRNTVSVFTQMLAKQQEINQK